MTMSLFGINVPVTMAGVWALVTTVTSGYFYLKKEREKKSLTRADKLNQILNRMERDDVALLFYDVVEHGKLAFENVQFTDRVVERQVDKMLGWFSYLCYLRRRRVITNPEFETFAYWISRTLSNDQILDYLECLYGKYILDVDERPFVELLRYGRGKGINRVDVLWAKYIETRPWWERSADGLLCKISNLWHTIGRMGRSRRDAGSCVNNVVNAVDDLQNFRAYLKLNYSSKSALSIYSCAIRTSDVLGSALSKLASTKEELEQTLETLNENGCLHWADLSNYRHAVKTYFKYSQRTNRKSKKDGGCHDRCCS